MSQEVGNIGDIRVPFVIADIRTWRLEEKKERGGHSGDFGARIGGCLTFNRFIYRCHNAMVVVMAEHHGHKASETLIAQRGNAISPPLTPCCLLFPQAVHHALHTKVTRSFLRVSISLHFDSCHPYQLSLLLFSFFLTCPHNILAFVRSADFIFFKVSRLREDLFSLW